MSDTATLPARAVPPGGLLSLPGGLPRLLAPGGADLPGHLRAHGPLPYRPYRPYRPHRGPGGDLIEQIRSAGLTGRGGAAFPAAVKLAAVADQASRAGRASGAGRAVVVGNGAEGEPASHKDKHLLWLSPHLVLDGLQLAAEAVGARRAVLYVHRHDQLHRRLAAALAERSAAGCDPVPAELVPAPPRFLAGEESALASRVGGGLARPTFTPPRVFERGVRGAPTLVQNVETLAHLALIARHGAAWFRAAGTAEEPGSMLVTAHRADGVTLVEEVPIGVPIAALLDLEHAPARAVLTGGYHGCWLPAGQAAALPLANAALRPAGATIGAGVIAALPPDRCGLAETARVLRYLAAESAGQCGPCLNGLPRIAAAFTRLSQPGPDPRGAANVADLERWAGLVTGRGACHHPDGTVRLVRSALAVFAPEIARHQRGLCAATEGPAFLPVPDAGPSASPRSRRDWR